MCTNKPLFAFFVSVESIFSIEDVRLSKDPGYRQVGRSNLGEFFLLVTIYPPVQFSQ